MPYIKEEKRNVLKQIGPNKFAATSGELNYQLTMVIKDFLLLHGNTYSTHNEIVGALECCKLEFYRRLTAELEDVKIEENGDVY